MAVPPPSPAPPVQVLPLVDAGLGNSAYLLDLGDGRALAVDASRDLRALRAAVEHLALKVAFAADTALYAGFPELNRIGPPLVTGDCPTALGSDQVQALASAGSPVVVTCGHGEGAMSGASLLARAGRRDVAVLTGGPGDWVGSTSRSLETRW